MTPPKRAVVGVEGAEGASRASHSSGALRRLLSRRIAVVGGLILAVVVLLGVAAPLLSRHGPNDLSISNRLQPPSADHPFGTDNLGRDVWSRTLFGTRLSLFVGISTAVITATLGTLLALLAGFYRVLDEVIMRVMDGLMALPATLLAIAIMAAVGPRVENMIVALSLVYLPRSTRVARSAVLVVREHVFVEAAVALGAPDRGIMRRHILPGVMSPVIVQATYVFATAVLLESALSFLGVGAPPEIPSWGVMLAEGRVVMRSAPWMTTYAGVLLALTVLSVNMLGDGLRDALDPKMKRG